MLALHATNLMRAFGSGANRTQALRGVSLAIEPGEVVLVMGPSGSGKSTLLAVLSGLLAPDSGQVLARDEDIWRLSPRARKQFRLAHCGFVFQGYNLFPALTARQQLEMVLRWGCGVSARDALRRADEMLDLLGLARKGDSRPAELSGGEQQRVAIGRALIKEPSLCFADEPTAALDWAHGQQVIELLRVAARNRGAAVVLVTHDPRIVPYADRVVHLEDGALLENASSFSTLERIES
jgi:putative ABC transport system ATP-binding protein